MDFFGALVEKIQLVGFAPLAPFEKSKPTYTLHTVVRDQLGMAERKEVSVDAVKLEVGHTKQASEIHITSDMADVAFWDYRELRIFLKDVHSLMDDEASSLIGKPIMATVWAHDQSRTQAEVVHLLKRLQKKHPSIEVPEPAQRRPSAKSMIQKGRVEASLANTLAVLAANGSYYGDLLEQCSRLDLNNEALLDHLDLQVIKTKADKSTIDKDSLIPRELVVAYMKKRAESIRTGMDSPTMCQFINSMNHSNNFAGNSDDTVLSRLRTISSKL